MFTIVQNDFDTALGLARYRLVNYTVWKFMPLIMKIFKTECLLNSKLPNTHVCLSTTQDFCPNPLLWVVISRKLATNSFLIVLPVSGLISFQQSTIESNKLNFMMKYHLDFLPTKFELATLNNS